MSPVKITFPKSGFPIPPTGLLVARGRADETILSVVGKCTPTLKEDYGKPICGQRLSFTRNTDKDGKVSYLWMIGFQLDPSKKYKLKVEGYSESGQKAGEDSVDVEPSTTIRIRVVETSVDYPDAGDHTQELCDGQPAWGSLSGADLAVSETYLLDVNGNKIPPSDIGPTSGQFWSVSFPPITEPANPGDELEAYILHVEDTSNPPVKRSVTLIHRFPCPPPS